MRHCSRRQVDSGPSPRHGPAHMLARRMHCWLLAAGILRQGRVQANTHPPQDRCLLGPQSVGSSACPASWAPERDPHSCRIPASGHDAPPPRRRPASDLPAAAGPLLSAARTAAPVTCDAGILTRVHVAQQQNMACIARRAHRALTPCLVRSSLESDAVMTFLRTWEGAEKCALRHLRRAEDTESLNFIAARPTTQ